MPKLWGEGGCLAQLWLVIFPLSVRVYQLLLLLLLSIYRKPNFYYLFLHLIQQANKFPEIWNHTPLEHLVDIARILFVRCWSHLICCCWSRFSGERYARETQTLKKKEDSFTIHNLKWKKEIEWKSKHFYYKLRDPLSWTWWSLHFLSLSHTNTHAREREEKGGGEEEKKGKEQNGTMGGT